MSLIVCPACGSTDVTTSERARQFAAPLGPPIGARQVSNVCSACGEEGDFEGLNDEHIALARAESARESIPKILGALAAAGLSMAYVERALGLPARTAARWKTGDTSAAALALLRIIATFPWTLEVASRGFDPGQANAAIVKEAARVLSVAATASGTVCSGQVTNSGPYVLVNFSAKVPVTEVLTEPQVLSVAALGV